MQNAPESMNAIITAYDAETAVDQTIPIRKRYEALSSIVVNADNIDEAKGNRTQLNALLKDAAAPRMRVQRAIKAHPIGKWAFTKSQLEKDIEASVNHLKIEIDAQERPESTGLKLKKQDWMLIVCGIDINEVNTLVGKMTEDGFTVENRGPAEPVGDPLPVPPPPSAPASDADSVFD